MNGLWEVDATWSSAPPDNDCSPAGNDTYNITHYVSSNCALISFSGSPTINVLPGGTFYLSGSGGVTGSVRINVSVGATIIVLGNLSLSGSSNIVNNGNMQIYGNVTGSGGSSFDCNGSGTGTVQIGGTGCARCTDGGCTQGVALPVNLASFQASSLSNGISVSWVTSYEENNAWFELERSIDGVNYSSVYRKQGKNNFQVQSMYEYLDTEVADGMTYYYRLSQHDFDGAQTRTDAISATFGTTQANLLIHPNPASSADLSITLQHMAHEDVLLVLYDVNGNQLCSKLAHIDSENETISANDLHTNLPPGIYMVAASNKNSLVRKKIVIH
ncbi:MAG: T9SS type A sorting domain-containing protein [Cytophagaceae bacterium]|nr:T9SS type A sorting domain-containing protein [Cytophagaceae bacterium]